MNLRQLSVNNGLSTYHVSDIEQDNYGFIWLATFDGLNRYDGVTCKVYRQNPDKPGSLSSNRIKSLYHDTGNNRLLVGTDGGGINVYDYVTDSFKVYYIRHDSSDWLPENDIIDIKPENDGRLWVATRHFIFLVRITDEDIFIDQAIDYPTNRVINTLISTDSTMFAVAKKRVVRYVSDNGHYIQDKDFILPEDATVNSVSLTHGNDFLLSTDNGLYRMKTTDGHLSYSKESTMSPDGLSDTENISAADIIGDKLYFIVNEKGLYCKEKGKSAGHIRILNENFWKGNTIKFSFIDRSNTLWLGSMNKGAGLIDLDQIKYERINLGEDGQQTFISELMYDNESHTLWIGTQKNGLFIREASGKTRNIQLRKGPVTDIKKFRDGSVKVVWNGYVYSWKDGRFKEIFPLEYGFAEAVGTVFNVCEDASGTLWLGCRKGLVCMDGHRHIKLETNFHMDVLPARSGNAIWACSGRNGLLRYETDDRNEINVTRHYTNSPDSSSCISSNTVMTLLEASDGEIYVGTEMGLNRIDPETFEICRLKTSKDILSSCRILSIQEDSWGRLWINTPKGVVKYNPETGEEKIYDSSDGLVSNFTTSASVITDDDILYIGTNEGVTSFCSTSLPQDNTPPQIAVSGFKVFGENLHFETPVMDVKQISLPHNHNSITFELSVLSFDNPQKNLYSYRLLGYEDNWTTVGVNHPYASYSKLKKGHYTFEFKGISCDGTPSDETARIKVSIRPAWWATILAYCIYSLLFMALLYFMISYERDRMRRKAKNEANEAKLKFYDNITHELRTPLTLIAAPLAELTATKDLPKEIYQRLDLMRKNCDRLMDIVNNFLRLRKVDSNGLPLLVKRQDISLIVAGTAQRFEPLARQKHIRLTVSTGERKMGWADEDKINIILTNLLSNALKFTESGGTVSVTLREDNGCYAIDVKDNGSGIFGNDLAHIFERFYQVEQRPVSGTGIGLELAKSLAILHRGSLTATSTLGKGSTFTLSIPYTKDSYTETEISEICSGEDVQGHDAGDMEELSREEDTSIRILVVEDDIEMSDYIRSILPEEYKVLVAENGKVGFETALDFVPDLIISDVMMPVMDGIEMCRLVTEDRRTSHIPVIMLTAKNDESEGLKSGAVDYIMKPFIPQNLLLKIRNQLRWRSEHSMNKDNSISIVKRIQEYGEQKEKEFLQQAYDIVEKNIGNSEFTVEGLMTELGVSKTQLHKKITALTGVSASTFVRNIRLDRGREMLETGRYSISDVLYSVGFSSPSYFSKKFKERFGFLPSDLLNKE